MNDPKRLLAPDGENVTGFERELLLAVVDERPSEAMSQRMLEATLAASAAPPAAAGIGAGAWLAGAFVAAGVAGLVAAASLGNHETTSSPAPSAGFAPATEPAHDVASPRRDARSPGNGDPVGDAASSLAADAAREDGSGSPPGGSTPDDSASGDSGTTEAPTAAAQRPSARAPSAQAPKAQAPSAQAPEAQAAPTHSTKARTTQSAPPGTQTPNADEQLERTLREEVELLDRARRALNARDAQGALAELARYDRRFPSGMLRKESIVLRERATALTRAPSP